MDQLDQCAQSRGHEPVTGVVKPEAAKRLAPGSEHGQQRSGFQFFFDEPFRDKADAQPEQHRLFNGRQFVESHAHGQIHLQILAFTPQLPVIDAAVRHAHADHR